MLISKKMMVKKIYAALSYEHISKQNLNLLIESQRLVKLLGTSNSLDCVILS